MTAQTGCLDPPTLARHSDEVPLAPLGSGRGGSWSAVQDLAGLDLTLWHSGRMRENVVNDPAHMTRSVSEKESAHAHMI